MRVVKRGLVLALALTFLMATGAMAGTLVDLYGDKDGLGIGVLANEGFDWNSVGPADGDGTDVWRYGSQSWSQTYDLSGVGAVTSAKIEVFHGGLGYDGLAELYLGSYFLGYLSDGDDVGDDYNYAKVDVFTFSDAGMLAELLDGQADFSIVAPSGGDGWALDYAELTINPVPIPGAVWLLGSGLVGLAGLRRRFMS